MTELIINGEAIELTGQETFPSSQIADIAAVEDIYSGVTKRIKIPKSRLNKKALDGLGNINSVSVLPYQKPTVKLKIEGFEVFPRGIAVIDSSDEFINVVIKYGNTNFFSELTDSIRNLDMSDLDQYWHIDTIVASQANTYVDGVVWPLIDFGGQKGATQMLVRRMRPCVFVCEIVDRIIDERGYYKVGEFWTSTDYRSMIIPCLSQWINQGVLDNMGVVMKSTNQITLYGSGFGLATEIDIPWISVTDYYYLMFGSGVGYRALVDVTFNVDLILETFFGNSYVIVNFIKVAQDLTETVLYTHTETNASVATNITILLNVDIELNAGDYLKINLDYVSITGIFRLNPSWLGLQSDMVISNVQATETAYGLGFPIAENLPDISKKDLLKSIAQMHGLMYNVNPVTGTIEIGRFEDIIKNKSNGNFYDLTNYLDLYDQNGDIEKLPLNFRLDKYGQETWFRFAEDNTVTPDLGDDSFSIPDENLPKTGTLAKLLFASTELVWRFNGYLQMPYIKYLINTPNAGIVDYDEEYNDIKPRILWFYSESTVTLTFTSIDSSQTISAGTVARATFKNATTLLANNYEGFQQTLRYYKEIKPKLFISAEQFTNFNHFYPVFLKQLGWFYCQSINKFSVTQSTEFALISLSSFIPAPSPRFRWWEQGIIPTSGTDVQTLNLSSGTQYASLYVKPNDPDVKTMFESLGSDLNYIQDLAGNRYTESTGVNDIGDWDYRKGYKIVMNGDANIDITGVELDDYFVIIGLENINTQWIGHPRSESTPIIAKLAEIVDNLTKVTNDLGHVYLPYFGLDQIGDLMPGEWYDYNMNADRQLVYDAALIADFIVDFTSESTDYLSLRWDFGDGSISTDVNPTHQYAETGLYTITLRAINLMEEEVEFSEIILVRDVNPGYKFNQITNSGYLIGF